MHRSLRSLCLGTLLAASSLNLAHAALIDLGKAGDYTMLASATGAGNVSGFLQLGSESLITGNVGGRSSVQMASGTQVSGRADGGTVTLGAGVAAGGKATRTEAYWTQVQADLVSASQAAKALGGALQSNADINRNFTASNNLGVYHFNNGFRLTSGHSLTLTGDADDVFVINIGKQSGNNWSFLMDHASVVLNGVRAENVFFNIYDSVHESQWNPWGETNGAMLGNGAVFHGNLLTANMYTQIGDGVKLDDARILSGSIMGNVQVVAPPPSRPPTDVPTPATGLLFVAGVWLMRKRARR